MGTLGLKDRELVRNLDEVPKRAPGRDHRHRGPVVLDQRRHRPRRGRSARSSPTSSRARSAGRLDDHPAAGEEPDPHHQARREPQDPRDRGSRSGSTRSSRRRRSSRSTSTPCTSARGPTASRPRPRRFFVTPDPGSAIPRGKRMDELTVGEAALLAGVISSPEGNNPFSYPDRAIRRRADALRADGRPGIHHPGRGRRREQRAAPRHPAAGASSVPTNYLVAEVQDRLLADTRLGNTPEERRNKLLKGGLQVYTTFDPRLQALAEDATDQRQARAPGAHWVSSLVVDRVRHRRSEGDGRWPGVPASQYNIATHVPGRQPGSTWKIITLAAALATGTRRTTRSTDRPRARSSRSSPACRRTRGRRTPRATAGVPPPSAPPSPAR